jgi:putative lipoprotein
MLHRALVLGVAMLLASRARAQEQDPENDPWFGRDKALHFAVSASLAAAIYAGSALKTDDRRTRAATAVIVTLTAGIAKETWDLAGYGDASWRDLTWDVVGTTTGVLIACAIDWAIDRIWSSPVPAQAPVPTGMTGR